MRLIIVSFILANFALANTGTRGGGDAATIEFIALQDQFISQLENLASNEGREKLSSRGIDIDKILRLKNQMKIDSFSINQKKLEIDGKEVSAINYPDARSIEFQLERWDRIDSTTKMQLVIHETLGLARIPDSDYKFSQFLLRSLAADESFYFWPSENGIMQIGSRNDPAPKILADALMRSGFSFGNFAPYAGADDLTVPGLVRIIKREDLNSYTVIWPEPDVKGISITNRKYRFRFEGKTAENLFRILNIGNKYVEEKDEFFPDRLSRIMIFGNTSGNEPGITCRAWVDTKLKTEEFSCQIIGLAN
jgi:hypothetical protein